jgi:hypothetical protein
MDDDPLITMADARRFGYCVAGVRQQISAAGLDLRTFIASGYPASVLAPTGPQAERLIAFVRKDRRCG